MFANQISLDFAQNQAMLLLEKINRKLNNKFTEVKVDNNKITLFIRKEDLSKLNGLVIPNKIGSLLISAKILRKNQRKGLHT